MAISSASRFASPELLALGKPPALAAKSHAELFAAALADFQTRMAADGLPYDVSMIKSDSGVKVLNVVAFRDMLRLQEIDDAVAQTYLGSATGQFLDHRAADYGVVRRTLPHTGADPAQDNRPTTVPPKWVWDAGTALWREDDDSLRANARLAWEALSVAGPRGAYLFHAGQAHPFSDAERTAVYGPETGHCQPGEVLVVVQSHAATGIPAPGVIDAIAARLDAAEVTYSTGATLLRQVRDDQSIRPLGARVIVRSAQPMPFHVVYKIYIRPGPDPETLRQTSLARLNAYLDKRRAVGVEVPRTGLIAAGHIAGNDGLPIAEEVELSWPIADVVPRHDQLASATSVVVELEVR